MIKSMMMERRSRWIRFYLIIGIISLWNDKFVAKAFVTPLRNHPLPTIGIRKEPRITTIIDFQATRIHQWTAKSTLSSRLYLVPIRKFRDDLVFLSESEEYRCCIDTYGRFEETFELGLAEEDDLPDLSRFVVTAFGADAINLSQDVTALERMLLKPAIELVNGYSGVIAFAEVLSGLRSRLNFRLKNGMDLSRPNLQGLDRNEQIKMAACNSIVLAVAKKQNDSNEKDWRKEIIASVELQLQPCDAKIPFTLPWLDRIERYLASIVGLEKNNNRDLQPYLSSLCVDEKHRGKGLGRALVRCVEDIANTSWGYSRLYLHVDKDNEAALNLYKSEGYKDVGLRWKPFWAGKASDIGYYVKNIGKPFKDADRELQKNKEQKILNE